MHVLARVYMQRVSADGLHAAAMKITVEETRLR